MSVIFFYIFASLLVLSAIGVVTVRNPIYSVLLLIKSFFYAAALILMTGAEFISFVVMIVYVGAVAVLFLFIVMMLEIDIRALTRGGRATVLVGAKLALIAFLQFLIVAVTWKEARKAFIKNPVLGGDSTNVYQIANWLYTDYFIVFQVAGLVLLVAMVGAIALTLRGKANDRKSQKVCDQYKRTPQNSLTLHNIQPGQRIDHA